MNYHKVLLDSGSTLEDRLACAQKILCSTHVLNIEQILLAFEKILKYAEKSLDPYLARNNGLVIMNHLLSNNIEEYIAVILALNSGFNPSGMFFLLNPGSYYVSEATCKVYCELLDYYDFNVDNLDVPEKIKMRIKNYRDTLYSGKYTKCARVATKNA